MSFLGVDVDDLRSAGAKCQEGAEETDQVISYLMILIAALEAASFFTGGASAAYARYLRTVVLPWLRQVSQALHLFAKVLGAHADAQDRASAGETVDWSALPTYTSPTNLPTSSTSQYPSVAPTTPAAPVPSGTTPAATPVGAGAAPATAGSTGQYGGSLGTIDGGAVGSAGPGGSAGSTGSAGSAGGSAGGSGTFPAATAGGVDGTAGTTDTTSTAGTGSTTVPSVGTGSVDGGTTGTVDGSGSGTAVTSVAGSNDRGNAGTYTAMGSAGVLGAGAAAAAAAGAMGRKDGGRNGELESLIAKTGRGARGEDVTKVQQMLTAAGYDTQGTDGQWGRNTEAAYQQWRAANPLQVAHGTGFTAPSGFDYAQIQGVRNNPHVTPEFLRRVEEVAQKNGTKPEWLMGVMSFETGGTFDPAKVNPRSGATGLIQFMPKTAPELHTSTAQLRGMTSVQQLDYVDAFLQQPWRRGKLDSLEGLYTGVLYGTPRTDPDAALFREGTAKYHQNREFDTRLGNNDGVVSVREAAQQIRRVMHVKN